MPQLRTRGHVKAPETSPAVRSGIHRTGAVDGHDLIGKMLEYEAAAHAKGIDVSSGRFEMLTVSERQFYRAELIADYIRLSAGNMGNTQGYFEAALTAFCRKICDMAIPSHELIGTYLATLDLVTKEDELLELPALEDAVKRTMSQVLQACVAELGQRAELAS